MLKRIVTAFVLLGLLISVPTFANPDQEPSEVSNGKAVSEVVERDVPALRKKVFKELSKATNDLQKRKYEKAEERLNKLLARDDLNQYELASVYNQLGFLDYKRNDYPASIKWYEKVVEQSPSIPLKLEVGTLYTIGQISLLTEKWTASLSAFEQYLELADAPDPNVYRNLAVAYWRTDQLEKGRPYFERHLQLLEEYEKEPNERGLEIIAAYEAVAAPSK
jgi:tetratricopeptide (TPR) repeat protein